MEGYTGDKSDFDQQSINLFLELQLKAKDEQIKRLVKRLDQLYEQVNGKSGLSKNQSDNHFSDDKVVQPYIEQTKMI
jgi:hypothetical protein